jgi:hypothetical protein
MTPKLKKYLVENILTGVSAVREDGEATTPEQDWEMEPQAGDVGMDQGSEDIHVKQEKLQQLLDKKDVILMQYKSGQLSLDQYKEMIGNIPQQIKKLRDQIISATTPSADADEELA